MDYAALKAEIAKPAYSGMTDAQIADAFNAATVEGWKPVECKVILGKLLGWGRWIALLDSEHPAARLMVETIRGVDNVHLEEADYRAGVEATLADLVTAELLNSEQAAALLDLGKVMTTPAAGIGWPQGVTEHDITHAREV